VKVSEQLKPIRLGANIATHSFLSRIASALQKKLAEEAGIEVVFIGKSTSKNEISATLTGQVIDLDEQKIDDVKKRVEAIMTNLKNPTNFVELLE